jgi:hypothetical protein
MISRFEVNEAFRRAIETSTDPAWIHRQLGGTAMPDEPNAYSRGKQIADYIRVLAAGGATRAFVPLLTVKEYDHYLQHRASLAPALALAMAVRDEVP